MRTKLTIELVPSTCWYSNVRSEVPKKVWDTIRRKVYAEAGNVCSVCRGKGPKWPVECHEDWHYNEVSQIQTLRRMVALCPACHEVKHMGLAQLRGRQVQATRHLMKVNEWGIHQANSYVIEQFEIWDERSKYTWGLDVTVLKEYGVVETDLSRGFVITR